MIINCSRQAICAFSRRNPLLTMVRNKAAYDTEGKTTVRIINKDLEDGLMIKSYASFGFRLNNGITVLGPMAIFPRTVLSWQVISSADITPESLKLFTLLEPKIDLLVIGLESTDRRYADGVLKAARAAGLNAEILTTEHAASTFNFLNAEGRSVAAALIPPLQVTVDENDMMQTQMHYNNLFKTDPQ